MVDHDSPLRLRQHKRPLASSSMARYVYARIITKAADSGDHRSAAASHASISTTVLLLRGLSYFRGPAGAAALRLQCALRGMLGRVGCFQAAISIRKSASRVWLTVRLSALAGGTTEDGAAAECAYGTMLTRAASAARRRAPASQPRQPHDPQSPNISEARADDVQAYHLPSLGLHLTRHSDTVDTVVNRQAYVGCSFELFGSVAEDTVPVNNFLAAAAAWVQRRAFPTSGALRPA